MTKPTLLIDGDILAYRAASVNQKSYQWDEDTVSTVTSEAEALEQLDDLIADLRKKLKGGDVVIALSDGRSFRYDVLPTYKHNRKETNRPLLLARLKEHLLTNPEKYRTFLRPRLEGDDVLGILMTHPKIIPGPKIQVSQDKDQKTIPGLLYNDKKDELVLISEQEADYWHMYQTLRGDTTDGYKGCPGVGDKRAVKILDPTGEGPFDPELTWIEWAWSRVKEAFEERGLTEDDAIQQARVARILRAEDYDFKKKEPILWTPIK